MEIGIAVRVERGKIKNIVLNTEVGGNDFDAESAGLLESILEDVNKWRVRYYEK